MKTLFTYLILLVLFITGTRLVATQQRYISSLQKSPSVERQRVPFQQYMQLASQADFRSATDTGVIDAIRDGHERTVVKSPASKPGGTLTLTAKNRQPILTG